MSPLAGLAGAGQRGQLFQGGLQRGEVSFSHSFPGFNEVTPELEVEVAQEELGAMQGEGHYLRRRRFARMARSATARISLWE